MQTAKATAGEKAVAFLVLVWALGWFARYRRQHRLTGGLSPGTGDR